MPGEGLLAGGGVLGSLIGFVGQERANKANRDMAREQMAFQERMSSTAHWREVQDLKRSGINPMLSAKLGGASTPPGASATMESSTKHIPEQFSRTMEQILTRQRIANETKATDANAKQADAQAQAALALAGVHSAQEDGIRIDNQNKTIELARQPLKQQQLVADLDMTLQRIKQSIQETTTSAAHAKEALARAEREEQIASILKGLAPIVNLGSDAIAKTIKWLSDPNTSVPKEVEPFFRPKEWLFHGPTPQSGSWGILYGPSLIKDRFIEFLRSAMSTGKTVSKTFDEDPKK